MGPVAAGVALTAKYVAKKPIESYDRKDKQRANNPPVGLVTPATDPDTSHRKIYPHDRHLERAGGSEYLECNGLERFVVTYVGRFPGIYRNRRPWNTREHCLLELLDDVNHDGCPTTLDEVRGVVEQCISKGWIEWAHNETEEHILRRTELGNQACGYGADGNQAYPAPTISDAEAAIRIILQILYGAKHDPRLRYRGDPRVKDWDVEGSHLYTWARHWGVSRDAFREAQTECLGEGFIASTPCYGGALHRITSRGERFLGGGAATDAEPVDQLEPSRAKTVAADDAPNENGYVLRPNDPTAYVPLNDVLNQHTPHEWPLNIKQLIKIVENYKTDQVRWTRPADKKGRPITNRRSIHLGDWHAYCKRVMQTDSEGFPLTSDAQIRAARAEIHRGRNARK